MVESLGFRGSAAVTQVANGGTVAAMASPIVLPRPTWRGRLHSWAFFATIPAAILLIRSASHPAAVASSAVFAGSMLLVFGTSATYHRVIRSERAKRVWQRIDHCMIYVLIAGTYVPMCILAMPLSWGVPLLSVVGAGAVLGVAIKGSGARRLQWLGYALYPVLGWLALVAGPVLVRSLSPAQLALVVGGGIAYTVGFPVLLAKRPDPWPRVFGYHEIWHVFTVVAAALHFSAVATIVAA